MNTHTISFITTVHTYPGNHKIYICFHFSLLYSCFFPGNLFKNFNKIINAFLKTILCLFIATRNRKSKHPLSPDAVYMFLSLSFAFLSKCRHTGLDSLAHVWKTLSHHRGFAVAGALFPHIAATAGLFIYVSYGNCHLSSEAFHGQPNRRVSIPTPILFS